MKAEQLSMYAFFTDILRREGAYEAARFARGCKIGSTALTIVTKPVIPNDMLQLQLLSKRQANNLAILFAGKTLFKKAFSPFA